MTATSPPVEDHPVDDRERAAAVVRSHFDRILWQRIDVHDGEVSALVAGTRHRRPHQIRVGTAAALGLIAAGVPTVGRRAGSGS